MKTLGFCLLILSLSVLQLKATGPLDYQTLAKWGNGLCVSKSVVRSPVALQNEKCEPYETFEIDLKDPTGSATFDTDKGSFSLAYTDGTMKVNSHSFTAKDILFRYPSEHKLPGQSTSVDSIEVQIELTSGSSSNVAAVLSFIFYDEGTDNIGFSNSKTMLNVFTAAAYSSPNFTPTLDFVSLTKKINQKIASDSVYLNLFTYAGTLTYPDCDEVLWYVYGSPIIAETDVFTQLKAGLNGAAGSDVTLKTSDGSNARPRTGTNGGDGNFAAIRLCYTGYFKNYMNYNYGLWFGVVIIVFWFIINLMLSEKPIKDSEYQENVWTNHPLYSLYHVGNDLFTRKTRMALILGTLTIHALFSSVWYRRTDDPLRKSNIIVYAVYSMLIDWAFIYIIGSMLRGYYVAKHQYYKTREEAWQQRSQNRIFGFYFSIFLCAVVLWPFCVWNMSELHPEKDDRASNYWVASFFIGLALEFLIVDPLVCLLAKSITPLRNLMKHRGYFYDNLCHETYLDHLKVD